MAGKEGAPQMKTADQALEAWQNWNKLTLTIEGAAALGAIAFGVPWLLALAATGAAVDGAQIVAINEVQKRRQANQARVMQPGMQYSPAAA